MRRCSVQLVLSIILAGLSACGRGPQPATEPRPYHTVIDWQELDGQLPRGGWAAGSGWLRGGWAGPAATFWPTIAFAAAWDSLGAEEFAARSAAERAWRREAAAELVQQAFLAVADHSYRLREGKVCDSLLRYPKVMTRVLQRLHTAVGTDPGSTEAWFHLATFNDVVGDRETAALARRQYLTATADSLPPPGEAQAANETTVRNRRCRLILDEAWDRRDDGHYEDCLAWLAGHAHDLENGAGGEQALPPAVEADLLRALCHAERGEYLLTRTYQARLPRIPLRRGLRTRTMDDLEVWVQVWLDLRTGHRDLAAWKVAHRQVGRRPNGIGRRFWQDMGQIVAELGDPATAALYWQRAYYQRPFGLLFPQTAHRLAGLARNEPDSELPYFQAYRTYFLAGSLWSYAVNRALACQAFDPAERPLLWRQAVGGLDACVRRGFQPHAARLLRARLHLQLGDWAAAKADLDALAVGHLDNGQREADVAFLRGAAALGAGKLPESRTWFERCVAQDPTHGRAWQALAVVTAYEGRHDEALAAFDRVEQLLPADGPNCFNRGLLNLQRGERQAALADLERAALLMPGNQRVVTLLQAVASGREVTIDLSPQPLQFVAATQRDENGAALDEELTGAGLDWNVAGELVEALIAGRESGDMTLALAIATGETPDDDLDDFTLLMAFTILLDHDRREDARAVLARARRLLPEDSAVCQLMEKSLM